MDRRSFLSGAFGVAALSPAAANAAEAPDFHGAIDAAARGLRPGAPDDQGRLLQALLDEAASEDRPVFLQPGRYVVSNIVLPARSRLTGVAGATRLVFAGDGHLVTAENTELADLSGLVFDGANLPLADYTEALVHLAGCPSVAIDRCAFTGSARSGLALDRCGGRVERTTVTHAAAAGIRVIESTGLAIVANEVADCGNGGILVWRWTEGEDGSIVAGNRIGRIRADDGGTGENGNGVNVFRAHGVIVSTNQIGDCAFTAVRANAANNVEITGNTCRNLGEVGIYSEFAFTGAVVANNIVDRAATGISIANFNDGGRIAVVAGNIVRDLTGKGPYEADPPGFGTGIAVEADAAVTGNVIDGAPLFGLALGWGPYLRDIVATGNVIRGAPVGIAVSVAEGVGSALISDNLISGAEDGAIVGMQWAERVSGDLSRGGAEQFPHLTIGNNRV